MKKLKTFIGLIAIFLLSLSFSLNAETILIDSTFTSDTEIFPFTPGQVIHGIKVSGSVELNSDTSLVRLVLYDTNYNEYLLYEAYPMISGSSSFSFNNECDETCYLDSLEAYSIEIQLIDAEVEITYLTLTLSPVIGVATLQKAHKNTLELAKVSNIQNFIDSRQMLWLPDTNGFSNLSYHEKKNILGYKYNLYGFDYYKGGIFDLTLGNMGSVSQSDLVDEFSWMDRHGALYDNGANYDDLNDPYVDIDDGWLTSFSQEQKCGHCVIFASVNTVESMTNIYFNKNYDIDLSEQQIASCMDTEDDCRSFGNWEPFNFIKNYGVVNENCFEYVGDTDDSYPCPVCNSPNEEIQIEKAVSPNLTITDEVIKRGIIENGPAALSVLDWNHRMMFYGYGIIKYQDVLFIDNQGNPIAIDDPNDSRIGHNYLLAKNSWKVNWGENGFAKVYAPCDGTSNNKLKNFIYLEGEIYSNIQNREIKYYDFDNDGYWNWGISETPPEGCLECAAAEPDSDDSNPRIGPFDENYYGVPVAPVMTIKDETSDIVPTNTFYTFYDPSMIDGDNIRLAFTIHNNGNAQLNLKESSPFNPLYPFVLDGIDADDFSIIKGIDFTSTISKEEYVSFEIEFTLNGNVSETKQATVTILNNEQDIDPYVINLVFTDCSTQSSVENISINTTWDDTKLHLKYNDVYVKSGAALTITGEVAFSRTANLFIEQGGKVYLNGGHLTALCDNLWPGVDVWGNSELPQYDEGNQGLIKITNGGTISYAFQAIETIEYDQRGEALYNTSGGVVMIIDGSIINCENGVRLFPYTQDYPLSTKIFPNLSSFTLAHFFNDDNKIPNVQLELDDVQGIRIRGCEFANYNPATGGGFINYSYGIKSTSSSFNVNIYTSQQGDITQSKFIKHNYGIYASASERYFSDIITVDYSYFEDNERGILLNAVDKPRITRNDILVKDKYTKFKDKDNVGIYLNDASTAYVIEQNNCYTNLLYSSLYTEECIGIVAKNNGTEFNEIYNNNFDQLNIGFEAIGQNRAETGEGLCVKCNDFSNCLTDVYIVPEKDENGNDITGSTIGIAAYQGQENEGEGTDPTLAAGNAFSYNIDFHFSNSNNCMDVTYTHQTLSSTNKIISPITYLNLSIREDLRANYSKELSCPFNYSDIIDPIVQSSVMSNATILVDSYSDTLNLLTDGGNTTALILDVSTSVPSESVQLSQQLINESPYLSDTVIKSAIMKENVLPNVMLKDILKANPQSAKSPEIMSKVNQRSNQMPDYMIDEILEGKNTFGAKEILEKKYAANKTKLDNSINKLEYYYISDTLNSEASIDSLISLLDNSIILQNKYDLAFLYYTLRDSLQLFSVLNNIPVLYDLTDIQSNTHTKYEDFFEIIWGNNHALKLDSTYITQLSDIAQGNQLPSVYAKNLLSNHGYFVFDEPVYFPEYNKSFEAEDYYSGNLPRINYLNIFPNPSGNYCIFDYNFDTIEGASIEINITDLRGIVIKKIKINDAKNQKVIPLYDCLNGVYFVSVIINGNIIENHKLVVAR